MAGEAVNTDGKPAIVKERGWFSIERKRHMTKKPKKQDALAELLAAASPKILTDLILKLAEEWPDVRRECFDFLKIHVSVSKALEKRSEGEIVLALWSELAPDLEELDEYGGGDYATEDHVAELLDQIRTQLDSKKVGPDDRREILDQVLPFIESGNAGMDDMLYEVAYATCYDDADLRRLAEAFEAMQSDWKVAHARRIYRRLGDRDKYLELRSGRMEYGADYHDLATFYWETGEKEKALQVAEEGLRKGQGRMDELRRFVADRAEAAGDRGKYLAIQFDQATDGLTLEKYKAFKKTCQKAEWAQFEPKVLEHMKDARQTEQLKIRMHREEYDEAVAILTKGRYPTTDWDDGDEIRTAKKLEKRYPEEILKYYLSGLGNLTVNATRKEYARKAKVMLKVRRLLVEVLGDEARWHKFAAKVKQDNIRRPAFQQEFAKVLPDWRELN
jgi:tetratricopeptide (TPR) repeat protein